ncbi:C40 family peptidase [Clostridium sp. DSM 100503]|uniref:C40 family peptidase n=1 Tax=Clostridium sp. DSM 100503 TaxID=2963282 RepID=UPI00214A4239|nr:C40 family peptidase [Clostridium sp. DSM 100503]MCR1952910.1 C40 family peptidase [Clostridium sp. DSM 100503]
MQQLNIGKKYKQLKRYKNWGKLLIKGLVALLSSTLGLSILIGGGILLFIVGINSSQGNISDLSGEVPSEYIQYYNEASEIFNIPNWVLSAVSKQESNFNPNASYAGAYGIMQIQKIDFSGLDLWASHINGGLGAEYKKLGYEFSSSDEMWNIYLKEPRVQILAGAYILRYYANYVLYSKGYVNKLDYNNNENMSLINWNSNENDVEFREILRRIFACYNGGPSYGMSVDLDNAQHDYPNKVFKYAMEFRDGGLIGSGTPLDNETIEKAIQAGMKWVGKSPYVWGGGRTEADVLAGRFDCSSFIHYMYASAGIQLGDRASVVTFSLVNIGERIAPKDMKRGDIIFFDTYTINGHVGVYLGEGKFIHDGTTNGVEITDMNLPYWQKTFNGKVRRVVN